LSAVASAHDLAVDIVISNHNYGDFVTEAIESACAQSHPLVNVYVVDDGSTDDSRERLRRYDGMVTVLLKEQGGQASALNAGLARCSGDVVMFLDADDLLRPDIASLVCETMAADGRVCKVHFRMDVVDEHGSPTGELKPPLGTTLPQGNLVAAGLAFPFDLAWLPTSGNAFRLATLRTVLPIPEHAYPRCGADWYLVHLATLLGRVAALDAVGASYRVHGRNNYERRARTLDLAHVRETVSFAGATTPAIEQLADQLEIDRPRHILSVSDLGNRLISLRLDPANHPVADERATRLLMDSVRAMMRRSDLSWSDKAQLVSWFVLEAALPRPAARYLAEVFLFPERRPSIAHARSRLRRERGVPTR
jgi:hypothetical protein